MQSYSVPKCDITHLEKIFVSDFVILDYVARSSVKESTDVYIWRVSQ